MTDPEQQGKAPTALEWLQSLSHLAALVAVAGLGLVSAWLQPINVDSAWMLEVARRLLEGARLYVDVIEVNPPLIIYLSVPPVLLSEWTGVEEVAAFKVYIAAIVAACAVLASVLLRRLLRSEPLWLRRLLELVAVFVLFGLPYFAWGQREHLAVAFVLPYVLLCALRATGGRIGGRAALAVGVLAGLGFGMKPHFLPVLFFVEAWVVGIRRLPGGLRRPEVMGVGALLAAYGVLVLTFTPEWFALVRSLAIPFYDPYLAVPAEQILLSGITGFALAVAVLFILTVKPAPLRTLGVLLLVTQAAFLLAVVVQRKGFSYQFFPVVAIAGILTAIAVAGFLVRILRIPGPLRAFGAVGLVAAYVITLACGYTVLQVVRGRQASEQHVLSDMVRRVEVLAPQGRVLVLSQYLEESFPLLNLAGARQMSRFPCAWWIAPAAQRLAETRDPGERQALEELEAELKAALAADLAHGQPELIIVDTRPVSTEQGEVDLLAYFAAHPVAGKELDLYRPVSRAGYRLFLRRTTDGEAVRTTALPGSGGSIQASR